MLNEGFFSHFRPEYSGLSIFKHVPIEARLLVGKWNSALLPERPHQIGDAINAARRLGDRFGYNGSGTGPYMEVRNLLDSFKQRSFAALASTGGEVGGLRKVANVMLNSDGRRALIELSRLPPNSHRAASLIGLISALSSGQRETHPRLHHHPRMLHSSDGQL